MAELTITDLEVSKDLPSWQGKGAKVYRLTVEGDERRPELFVPNDQSPPEVGTKIPGIEDSEYGPKVQKAQRSGGGGGFKKSPEQEKRIVRQHSQEMACRVMATLGSVLSEEQFVNLVQWFVDDAYGKMKAGSNAWPLTSDVPADISDFDPAAA